MTIMATLFAHREAICYLCRPPPLPPLPITIHLGKSCPRTPSVSLTHGRGRATQTGKKRQCFLGVYEYYPTGDFYQHSETQGQTGQNVFIAQDLDTQERQGT